MLVIHVAAGSLALLSGFVALYSTKGGNWHRRAGRVFVVAMLVMCAAGLVLSLVRDKAAAINLPAAMLTAYLVATAWFAVRPSAHAAYAWHVGGWVVVSGVLIACTTFGLIAVSGNGRFAGFPAFPYLLFAAVALFAWFGDLRILRDGTARTGLTGTPKIARHLWRITVALWIACMSFFLGQADEFPEALRIPVLLVSPVMLVLLTLLYWLWRVRVRGSLRGMRMRPSRAAA